LGTLPAPKACPIPSEAATWEPGAGELLGAKTIPQSPLYGIMNIMPTAPAAREPVQCFCQLCLMLVLVICLGLMLGSLELLEQTKHRLENCAIKARVRNAHCIMVYWPKFPPKLAGCYKMMLS